jgi:hypothetical protein
MGSKTKLKTWSDQEILTHTDLNDEFDRLYTSPMTLISPADATLNMDGNKIDLDDDEDSSIRETADDIIALELGGFDAIIFDGTTASTVGGLSLTTAAEAGDVAILAQGTGTDLGISITSKGAGNVTLVTGTGEFIVTGDIESGTYTPELLFGGANVDMTYTTQTGSYRRIGNMVFIQVQIVLSAKGSSSGAATIDLPITAAATIPAGVFSVGIMTNVTGLTGSATAWAKESSTNCWLYVWRSDTGIGNSQTLAQTNFSDTSEINISGWYEV